MIRKLILNDDALCQALIQQQPAENLFIIGDIEAFGYEENFQELWGDFTETGTLRAVLLRYQKNFIPFSMDEFDAEGFAQIINKYPNALMLSGLAPLTAQMTPYLTHNIKEERQTYYAKATRVNSDIEITDLVKRADIQDIDRLGDLLKTIPEFRSAGLEMESRKRNMEKGVSRTYYIEEDGQIVASASTTAENKTSAMVVAVCTREGYRSKGYATQCVAKLCRVLLNDGKQLCLFYDNPEAGKIYKRIGFEDIGHWMMISLVDVEDEIE